jgi:hypothetical protein
VQATQIRQKDGIFYFVSYRAKDLLARVRFHQPFLRRGRGDRPVARRPGRRCRAVHLRIERNDHAFQRALSRAKIRQLTNFYETAVSQPAIPGTVLLYHVENAFVPRQRRRRRPPRDPARSS